jgi:hypothetical protein
MYCYIRRDCFTVIHVQYQHPVRFGIYCCHLRSIQYQDAEIAGVLNQAVHQIMIELPEWSPAPDDGNLRPSSASQMCELKADVSSPNKGNSPGQLR